MRTCDCELIIHSLSNKLYYGKAFTDDIPMGVIFTDECCEKKLAEEFDAWQKFAFPDKPNIIAGMIVGIRCIQLFFNSSEDTERFFVKYNKEFIEDEDEDETAASADINK